ncbi:hypothetical protein GCM10017744_082130 [Streptomyces antimycoticus]|uniref:Uncharacterized protein n=1 Tax=Streptomyces antimycoticus TaxID=68175 RepID=A0A4D4JWB6_9ACTN|nr:hypothetical protein SSPO_081260 [Streptomyces antimycoticus]GDY41041.1 hypothetical protein SANT12839_019230 [Streptomyces antimycoticus]
MSGGKFGSGVLGDLHLARAGELNDAFHGWLRKGVRMSVASTIAATYVLSISKSDAEMRAQ